MNPRQKPLPSPPSHLSRLQNAQLAQLAQQNAQPPKIPAQATRPSAGRRVLGSVPSRRTPAMARTGGLSPSASSVSLRSEVSTEGAGREETPGSMVCPICSEEMMTLLQLNRHLDDMHREVEEMEKDDVKSWFLRRVQKARQFQPVAVLNQKLKGLDVFESNAVVSPPPVSTPASTMVAATTAVDPDSVVTRTHWQRTTANDYCLEPSCRRPLGAINGSINCRCCGRLFCEEHTMYQMKLSRSAVHEPVRGFWCRVCETCYKSREGYNDHHGVHRDHTSFFIRTRKASVDRAYLETSRLEKRLTKLTQLLANPPPLEQGSGFLRSMTGLRNQRRMLEQTFVPWEDDTTVPNCPYCKQTFSQLSLRKHHCRVCGKVVCGDPRTGCSTEMGLNVAADPLTEKSSTQVSLDIRMCTTCKTTIFSKRDFQASLSTRPPSVRAYETLVQFERGILTMMPRFEKLLATLQKEQLQMTKAQIEEATRTRKKLTEGFTQYDSAAKRILNLPTTSPAQKRLQQAIHQHATSFLHQNMLPLKSLPRILKSNKRHTSQLSITSNTSSLGTPTPTILSDTASQVSTPSAFEIEEKNLKEQCMVLQEQRFFVEQMLGQAVKGRRFDEIKALKQSVIELDEEIHKLEKEIEKLEAAEAAEGQ